MHVIDFGLIMTIYFEIYSLDLSSVKENSG